MQVSPTGNPDSAPRMVPAARRTISDPAQQASIDNGPRPLDAAVPLNTARHSQKQVRAFGTRCIWPRGLRDRYGVSAPTLWRWERAGKLPKRDVFLGGRPIGWRPETIERAERGE